MSSLYRPTIHQIHVLPAAGETACFAWTEAALNHLARWVSAEEVQPLRDQLAAARERGQPERDARVALVRSHALYPVPDDSPLCAALFAYWEGASLILHFIWHWDGDGDASIFAALREFLWQPPSDLTEHAGEGLLLTAALKEEVDDRAALAEALLKELSQRSTALAALTLRGATLHVPRRRSLTPAAYPAVLLFDDSEVEKTPAADRFATVIWPLVVLYTLRVEGVYLRAYRNTVDTRLREGGEALSQRLDALFGEEAGNEHGLFSSPEPAQAALASLMTAQHRLYQALAEAEEQIQNARRDLVNLTEILSEALTPGQERLPLTASFPETAIRQVSAPARRMVAQMEADAAQARVWAERAAHAVDALRTQADLLQARYEWSLNWVIGLVGSAIAAAQLVDTDMARNLRAWMNRGLATLHFPYRVAENETGAFLVRGIIVILVLIMVVVLMKVAFTLSRRGIVAMKDRKKGRS